MTSRELTEAIDSLVWLRIEQRFSTDPKVLPELVDRVEVQKRAIADALKLLDHRPGGVYRDDTEGR